MLKACARCGGLHPIGYRCSKGREYKRDEEKKLRSSRKWTNKAIQIKKDSKGLCEVCKALGVYTYNGLEVHHIIKVKDNPSLLLDDDNLITLCTYHHKEADAGNISADYLRELVAERKNNGT